MLLFYSAISVTKCYCQDAKNTIVSYGWLGIPLLWEKGLYKTLILTKATKHTFLCSFFPSNQNFHWQPWNPLTDFYPFGKFLNHSLSKSTWNDSLLFPSIRNYFFEGCHLKSMKFVIIYSSIVSIFILSPW